MILVSIPENLSGVDYHRLYIPFKNMEGVIFEHHIEGITKKYLQDNNITQVWFNRNISPEFLDPNRLFKIIKSAGCKIVCDIDDYWNMPYGHVLRDVSIRMNLRNSNISQIKHSDYVVCTHSVLADMVIKELGVSKHKLVIAPNAIDPNEPQYNQEFKYNLKNIFWQGSVTHHYDLKLISEAVNTLNEKLFIGGYVKESYKVLTDVSKMDFSPEGHIFDDKPFVYLLPYLERYKYLEERHLEKYYHWEEMGKMFNRKQWINEAPVTEYMNFYQDKGICLIPLEKSKFTSCKSNLKMLEAGWAKKPVVVSGVYPYTSLANPSNCRMAGNTSEWIRSIKYLKENPNAADDLRFKLHEDIKQNYLIDKANQSRLNIIK